jgi:sigma-B regulation protein RsbU (phosphoserine phosphatase)
MRTAPAGRERPQTPTEAMLDCLSSPAQNFDALNPLLPQPQPRYTPPNLEPTEPEIQTLANLPFDLDSMQAELDALKQEINLLRRRDETLKFYMTRLDEELRLAARLQQEFLPRTLPQVGNVHFHTLFRPAGYVSGDLYDVMRLDEKRVGIFLVDAVGHGMPAALLTMFIKRALVCKEITTTGYQLLEPAETMRRLNDALIEQNLSQSTFCTALYGVLNTETLQLQITSGGHPAPLLCRGGQIQDVSVEGALLGIFPEIAYEQSHIQLQTGDRLLIYSDGIEIAFNVDMASHDGRWRKELADRASLPVEQMLTEFGNQIDNEIGSLQPKDDLTLLAVEIK